MNRLVKYGVLVLLLVLVGWTSFGIYRYLFDLSMPELSVEGLQEGGYYCGDMRCKINANKTGELSVWLDGKPLISGFRFGHTTSGHLLPIPTKTLTNGKHVLKVELIDRAYHKNTSSREYTFYIDNIPLQAALIKQEGQYKTFQGRILHLQLQVNKEIERALVTALSHSYECFPESKNSSVYECFIPIPCEEAPNEYLLTTEVVDRVGNNVVLESKFQVIPYPFKKQVLNVSAQKVAEIEKEEKPEAEDLDEVITRLTHESPREKLWRSPFCTPIDVLRVTCEFGTIRTSQKKGRYMHKAIDVINLPKCVVWACQDGVVVLKERYPMSGNTVIIDHGWGVLSLCCHLDSFADITVGKKIAQGSPIGTMGKTGYATGEHVHWAIFAHNVPVDPMQWTKLTF